MLRFTSLLLFLALTCRGAELVRVDYEELPPVTDVEAALRPESALVEESWGDNVLISRDHVMGDPDGKMRQAVGVVKGVLQTHRYTGAAIEPRAYLATHDPYTGMTTMWASTQVPHEMRAFCSRRCGPGGICSRRHPRRSAPPPRRWPGWDGRPGRWERVNNNMPAGHRAPLYGLSGFNNAYNTYTWSMSVWNNARDEVARSAGELLIVIAATSPTGRCGL